MGALNIKYMPCTTIKGQVLADLVAEFTEYPGAAVAEEGESVRVQVTIVPVLGQPTWKLYVVGLLTKKALELE